MTRNRWTVGIDFGATVIKLGLVAPGGRVARFLTLPSGTLSQPSVFIERVSRVVEELAESVGERASRLQGVGIGVPGTVDSRRGTVRSAVNIPGWYNMRLGPRLQRRLGCPCRVDNDANLVALGEWRFGAGREARQLVCLTLGTGVGGALIMDGALYRGANGSAGELGHLVVDPRGPRCGCGARGCLEAFVGTAGILRLGRRAVRQGAPRLAELVERAHGRMTPKVISKAARMGDTSARRVWVEVGRWLGIGLASLVNLLNPDRVVIGGGVANAWRLFHPTLIKTMRTYAMASPARRVRIVRAQLGNSAGIVGAVLLWGEGAVARGLSSGANE